MTFFGRRHTVTFYWCLNVFDSNDRCNVSLHASSDVTCSSSLTLSRGATAVSVIAAAIPPARKSLANDTAVSPIIVTCSGCSLQSLTPTSIFPHNHLDDTSHFMYAGLFFQDREKQRELGSVVQVCLFSGEMKPGACFPELSVSPDLTLRQLCFSVLKSNNKTRSLFLKAKISTHFLYE